MSTQPYHDGEIAVQEQAGERDIARRHGAAISSRIVPGALPILARQRVLAVSAAGDDGHLWTSVWCGEPGFVRSADGQHVNILPQLMDASPDDPVVSRLAVGRDVGLLAIEFTSRRRLRINGKIERISGDEIAVIVRESLPNCPKYIQRRHPYDVSAPLAWGEAAELGRTVDEARQELIESADTAFVGSLHPVRGVDTSHRGGEPGFIRVVDPSTLRIPDYPGNGMFMTLGNYAIDSRASLTVLDFERGRIAAFSGSARLCFDVENPRHPAGGTGRYWEFGVREWIQYELSASLRWEFLDASPFNPAASRK